MNTFASSLDIPITFTSSAIELKICAITAETEKYKSINKKKKKKHDEIVLLAKSKLSNIKVVICKALINSSISHDEFVEINNVPKKYDKMKEEIKKIKRNSSSLWKILVHL